MTIQEIVDKVNSRPNPVTGQMGYLRRDDILSALKIYNDKDHAPINIATFLSNFSFLSDPIKEMIVKDVDSYQY